VLLFIERLEQKDETLKKESRNVNVSKKLLRPNYGIFAILLAYLKDRLLTISNYYRSWIIRRYRNRQDVGKFFEFKGKNAAMSSQLLYRRFRQKKVSFVCYFNFYGIL
jgi:hypothetical protein